MIVQGTVVRRASGHVLLIVIPKHLHRQEKLALAVFAVHPPRPFLGPAAFEAKPKIGVLAANTLIAWLSGANWKNPIQSIKLP